MEQEATVLPADDENPRLMLRFRCAKLRQDSRAVMRLKVASAPGALCRQKCQFNCQGAL